MEARLQRSSRQTYCEWKGNATYWKLDEVADKIWSYEKPTSAFAELKGHLSFYAGPWWDIYVDGEKVEAQPGNFYGGWLTSDVEGVTKGGPGTWGW